eukprot:292985-Chlamydomonas_euryale.AAC.4
MLRLCARHARWTTVAAALVMCCVWNRLTSQLRPPSVDVRLARASSNGSGGCSICARSARERAETEVLLHMCTQHA